MGHGGFCSPRLHSETWRNPAIGGADWSGWQAQKNAGPLRQTQGELSAPLKSGLLKMRVFCETAEPLSASIAR